MQRLTHERHPRASDTCRGLSVGARRDQPLDEEIRTHLAFLGDEHPEMTEQERRMAARRAFGGVDQVKEAYRDQRSIPTLETFSREMCMPYRTLMRSSGFASASVVILAFGFAATVGMFTILQQVVAAGLDSTGVSPLSGPRYRGSNPCLPAMEIAFGFNYFQRRVISL